MPASAEEPCQDELASENEVAEDEVSEEEPPPPPERPTVDAEGNPVPPPPPERPTVDADGNPVPPPPPPERPTVDADGNPVDGQGDPVPPPPPERPTVDADGNPVPPPPPERPAPLDDSFFADEAPPCTISFQLVEVPGVRTWEAACIDRLDGKPIVLKYKGPTERGTFTLRPSSESEGAITGQLRVTGPGYRIDSKGKGRYRVVVMESHADGTPRFLDIVYSTTGKTKQCTGGICTTSKLVVDEALIPLEAQFGSCGGGQGS